MNNSSNHNQFSSRFGFIAAAAGSSVGLYNMWKFPFEAGNAGGGCFLFIYLFCVLILGYPLLLAELSLGRYTGVNTYQAYANVGKKGWKLVGGMGIIMAFMLLSFYQVVSGWILGYAYESARGTLLQSEQPFGEFYNHFIQDVPSNVVFVLLINIAGALIISQGVKKGIERWNKILMPLFVVMLLGLIAYAFTLDNALEGVLFFLRPDFSAVTLDVFYAALEQCLSSIGIGIGVLITYGGYLSKRNNLANSAAIIALGDTLVSILAGLLIFPLLFHLHLPPTEEIGLIFISLPSVFKALGGILGPILGVTFFLLLSLATITSSIAILENILKFVVECYGIGRRKAVCFIIPIVFILNLGCILSWGSHDFFTNFFTYHGKVYSFFIVIASIFGFLMPIMCLLLSCLVIFRWKTTNFLKEVNDKRPWLNTYVRLMVSYVCPVVMGIIVLLKIRQLLS